MPVSVTWGPPSLPSISHTKLEIPSSFFHANSDSTLPTSYRQTPVTRSFSPSEPLRDVSSVVGTTP